MKERKKEQGNCNKNRGRGGGEDGRAKTCFQTFRHYPRGPTTSQAAKPLPSFFLSFFLSFPHTPRTRLIRLVTFPSIVSLLCSFIVVIIISFLPPFPNSLHLLFTPFRGSFLFYTGNNLTSLSLSFPPLPRASFSLTNPAPFLILNGGPLYSSCYCYCFLHSSLLFCFFVTSTGRLKGSPLLSRMQLISLSHSTPVMVWDGKAEKGQGKSSRRLSKCLMGVSWVVAALLKEKKIFLLLLFSLDGKSCNILYTRFL